MKLFNYVIELHLRANRKWTDPIFVRRPYYSHFVCGKISLFYGQPHLEPVTVCAQCHEEIQRVGEDSLDWCEGCQSVEGNTIEMTTEEYEAANG